MEIKEVLFPELEAEIKRQGYNYTILGERIGLSTMAVSNRMRGKVEFSVTEAQQITDLLNKDFKDLFRKNTNAQ